MSQPLNFAGKVKLFRRAAGLTVAAAEKKCGLRAGRLEKIESGEHEPRAGDFLRILKGFRVSADAFDPSDFEVQP